MSPIFNIRNIFKRRIYLDYASLTPMDPRVICEVKRFSAAKYANPSSWYREGVAAKKALDIGRKKVADILHAHPDEIIFTSGGTEANCLAIEGVVKAAKNAGVLKPHIIISVTEHSSIIEVASQMEKWGCEVTKIGVDKEGVISLDELKKAIKPNTVLVSIMTVNNELGTVQPIREIAKIIRDKRKEFLVRPLGGRSFSPSSPQGASGENLNPQAGGNNIQSDLAAHDSYPLFHTDAAQAALYNELYVEKLGVDLLTLDGSKIYGPRGVGALFIKRNTPIEPIIYGGGQEGGVRSGTENLPGIAGFAKALDVVKSRKSKVESRKVILLRNQMVEGLQKIRADIKVNGPIENADNASTVANVSPHILNVSIPGIDNEFFAMQLDANGVVVSTKSSCLRDEDESYVLKAIGGNSRESVRFSFGRWTTMSEIAKTLRIVAKILRI